MSVERNDRYFSPGIRPLWILMIVVVLVMVVRISGMDSRDVEESGNDIGEPFRISGDAENGRIIYEQLCLSCHGETGDGLGPAGRKFSARLPDFTNSDHMFSLSDRSLFTIVRNGGRKVGKSEIMHAWESLLTTEHIHDVLAYIKTFAQTYANAPFRIGNQVTRCTSRHRSQIP